MHLKRYIKVKDRLLVLMIICLLSNIIFTVFSIDYLRKMDRQTERMYEEKLLALAAMSDFELAIIEGETDKVKELQNTITTFQFDSKMEFYIKELSSVVDYPGEAIPLIQEVKNYIMERADSQLRSHQQDISFGYKLLLGVSLVLILIILYVSMNATKAVNLPTRQLKRLLKQAEQGDFTHIATYDSKDELGEVMLSYNQMASEVKELLYLVKQSATVVDEANEELQKASEKTTEASIHISKDAADLTMATMRSTEKLTLTTNALQEIASGVEIIESRIRSIENSIGQTVAEANEGVSFVLLNIEQMEKIEQAVIQTNDRIKVLEKHSEEIGKVIQIIHEIAQQTNLLALNAAIEAARAGEHGKGFSIVADEVRKLAVQSVQSSRVIEEIVGKIQKDTKKSVHYMGSAIESVQTGIDTTNQTAAKFQQIVSAVNEVGPHIGEVSSTIHSITENTKDVAESSKSLSEVSKDNAKRIEDVSNSTNYQLDATKAMHSEIQKISKNIRTLSTSIKRFNV